MVPAQPGPVNLAIDFSLMGFWTTGLGRFETWFRLVSQGSENFQWPWFSSGLDRFLTYYQRFRLAVSEVGYSTFKDSSD